MAKSNARNLTSNSVHEVCKGINEDQNFTNTLLLHMGSPSG